MRKTTIHHRALRRVVIALAVAVAGTASLETGRAPAAAQPTLPDVAAHGEYLVTGAGQCADCHGANLGGAPLHIPGPPGVPWAKAVPSIRGLPMFASDTDALRFLTTATFPDGTMALHPMPHYTFNETDARAIVTYLRSLTERRSETSLFERRRVSEF